ncbi:MAG TPA: LamG domain-containing protein [Verrucomicrobiae bacterium]|nr:LamG domain-containing protein [Verrucomicrobiae bacterium]
MVAWWTAEATANDLVNGNDGILKGRASYTAGEVGYAFDFDGTNGTVVVPDSPSLRLTNELTIEAWINTTSTNIIQAIVSKVSIESGDHGYQFVLVGNELVGQFNGPGQPWPSYLVRCPVSISLGTWNHVAWTYDQSAMALYLNGDVILRTIIGPRTIAVTRSNLRISGADDHDFFRGQVDEPCIYNRALSSAEIKAIYNAGMAGKCLPEGGPKQKTK